MPFGHFHCLAVLLCLIFWHRFCFIPDKARFLLDLEKRFFNEQRVGNSLLTFSSLLNPPLTQVKHSPVPVIAIFTKFDDLISQVYDTSLKEDENRKAAEGLLKDNLRAPLFEYKFPPRADVCLEGTFRVYFR